MNNPFKLDRVAVRLVEEPPLLSKEKLNTPEKVVNAFAEELKQYDREVIAIINMQTDSKPINITIASVGMIDGALASPREILKAAILSNATGIIMLHNHPSGNLLPSQLDVRLTDKLKMVCDLIDVKLLDHIIVGRENEYYSFHENNIIPNSYVWLSRDADKIRLNESREDSKESTLKRLELAKRKSYGERKQKEALKHCPKSL